MINHNATILSIIKSYVGDANKRTQAEIAERREWEQLSLCEVS